MNDNFPQNDKELAQSLGESFPRTIVKVFEENPDPHGTDELKILIGYDFYRNKELCRHITSVYVEKREDIYGKNFTQWLNKNKDRILKGLSL